MKLQMKFKQGAATMLTVNGVRMVSNAQLMKGIELERLIEELLGLRVHIEIQSETEPLTPILQFPSKEQEHG